MLTPCYWAFRFAVFSADVKTDNETGDNNHYDTFITALRSLFKSTKQKQYYLSASPSCSLLPSTPQMPASLLNKLDFIWPQFYAAPSCNIGTTSFLPSLQNWTSRLDGPKLFIGAPAWEDGTSNGGYESHTDFARTVVEAKEEVGREFGGVMLWDGAWGMANLDDEGTSYVDVVKGALES